MPDDARRLLLIGIGAGDPKLLTIEAAEALATTDVVFVLDKGDDLDDLAALRREVLAAHAGPATRTVTIADPERDLTGSDAYADQVAAWHAERVQRLTGAVAEAVPAGGTGAFLCWGDPSLYDSTLRVVEAVAEHLPWPVAVDVLPGISSLHLLTARHRIPLNRVGAAVRLTTGRRLLDAPPDEASDVVVFLDGRTAFTALDPAGLDLYWGAYLGTDDELLVAGALAEVADEVVRVRAEARARKGWMFDTYLLRWRG